MLLNQHTMGAAFDTQAYNAIRTLQVWLGTIACLGIDTEEKAEEALLTICKQCKWETELDENTQKHILK